MALKFGKLPVRAAECFGVSGLLGEGCEVYYENIFSTRHLGRISDLLAARLRKSGPDELRLRTVMLFAAFQAYRAVRPAPEPASTEALAEPLTIECGLDGEKLALGISFNLSGKTTLKFEGMAERIQGRKPEGYFEAMLVQMLAHAHRVVLRSLQGTPKLEVICLVGVAGRMERSELAGPHQFELIQMSDALPAPGVSQYTALGDLDYKELLKEDRPGKKAEPSPTGEILARLTGPEEENRIQSSAESEQAQKVQGAQEQEQNTVVAGKAGEAKEDILRVKGGAGDQEPEHKNAISGQGEEDVPTEGGSRKSKSSFLERVFTFWRSKVRKGAEGAADGERIPDADRQDSQRESAERPDSSDESLKPGTAPGSDQHAERLEAEFQEGGPLDRVLQKARAKIIALKPDSSGADRIRKWADGLMAELLSEKARLKEFAKDVANAIRQKEMELNNKQAKWKEEIRRKDEELKQKTLAITRLKEQMVHLQEKTKEISRSLADEAALKQKYSQAQKLLNAVRAENVQLTSKVEELRKRPASASRASDNSLEVLEMRTRLERIQRSSEEFRKSNQKLTERLNERSREAGTSSAALDDIKKRLEEALKSAQTSRKENERLQNRVRELEREQQRLKADLQRASIAGKLRQVYHKDGNDGEGGKGGAAA